MGWKRVPLNSLFDVTSGRIISSVKRSKGALANCAAYPAEIQQGANCYEATKSATASHHLGVGLRLALDGYVFGTGPQPFPGASGKRFGGVCRGDWNDRRSSGRDS